MEKKKIWKNRVYKKGLVIAVTLVLVGGILIPTINAAKPAGADDDWDYWTSSPHVILNTTGNVSIGAGTSPVAKLQVGDGTVLFNGTTGNTPVSGAGTRIMWIPAKSAFRAGSVTSTQWDDSNIASYSVATGRNTIASGNWGATAMGDGTNASGNHGATAMGELTTASGIHGATAMGGLTTASGDDGATAMGYDTTASGDYGATAMGHHTTASGISATAMGAFTTASGNHGATAMGYYTTASGNYGATAMGRTITVSGETSVGIGLNSTSYTVSSPNVMSIMGGNVGIGITSPSEKLDVSGNVHASGSFISGSTTTYGDGAITLSGGTNLNIDSNTLFVHNANNRVGMGTTSPTRTLDIRGLCIIQGVNYPQYIMKSVLGGAQEWSFYGADTGFYIRNRDNAVNPFAILNDTKHKSLVIDPSEVVVNENSYDLDFRVESNGNANMLFVNAGNNRVGIGTNSPSQMLHISGGHVLIDGHNSPQYIMESALGGAQEWSFYGSGSGFFIRNRDNAVNPFGIKNDAKHASLVIDPSEVVVNENSYDLDFRVESNNNTNMFLVDASTDRIGINTSSPSAMLHVHNGTVLFNGTTGDTPISGAGTRLMWIPSKAAFRAGGVPSNQWDDSNIGSYSVATGYNTTASGDNSTAMGERTNASGVTSTAMSASTTASGTVSTAVGFGTTASGDGATAIGVITIARGLYSTAMGYDTNASGAASTAMGAITNASGAASTAMGYNTTASGNYSTAIGRNITVSGINSVGIGLDGTPFTVSSNNVMSIMGGNVGIGTSSPGDVLDVNGDIRLRGEDIKDGGGTSSIRLVDNGYMYLNHGGGGGALVVLGGGKVGIGTTAPYGLLEVEEWMGTVASFDRAGNDGMIIALLQDGTLEGTITVSGATVSYNSFTGSHYADIDDNVEEGYLVALTGNNKHLHNNPDSEIIYGVTVSHEANSPDILGAYLAPEDSSHKDSPHLVMAVGNGVMWVIDNGFDIRAGDYLISSDTYGHAMKDTGDYDTSYVVARAAEGVNWDKVTETIDGIKHRKISVFFESFALPHNEDKIKELEAENVALEQRIKALEQTISQYSDIDNSNDVIRQLKNHGIPSFQIILLLAAMGLALILLRKRKHNL